MSNYDSYGAAAPKPDTNCRTCTDFKFWSKQQSQLFHNSGKAKSSTQSSSSEEGPGRKDCPLDKTELGHATWGLLHTMAAFYEDKPTDSQKKDVKTFMDVLSRIYPCQICASDFRIDIKEHPVNVNSQSELSLWMCNFHNRVNEKIGKPKYDCSKVNERWRDGWLDGSCD